MEKEEFNVVTVMVMVNMNVMSVMVMVKRTVTNVMAMVVPIVKPVMEKDTWKMKKEMKQTVLIVMVLEK
jgi:hypothetical protein